VFTPGVNIPPKGKNFTSGAKFTPRVKFTLGGQDKGKLEFFIPSYVLQDWSAWAKYVHVLL
jgi:hypothetical protein